MRRFAGNIPCNCRPNKNHREIRRLSQSKKDGAYATFGIRTVPFSVSDCFLRQAKRFLEKNVSSYNSPSSV